MVYVLDTSAILSGIFFGTNIATTPLVLKEFKPKGHSWRLLQTLKSAGLEIISPTKESISFVIDKAKKTGDVFSLSETDIELLAATYETNGILLSDDYAIQNVASFLGVQYKPVIEEGISKKITWIFRCKSCGKIFEENLKFCSVCGGIIKRNPKK